MLSYELNSQFFIAVFHWAGIKGTTLPLIDAQVIYSRLLAQSFPGHHYVRLPGT